MLEAVRKNEKVEIASFFERDSFSGQDLVEGVLKEICSDERVQLEAIKLILEHGSQKFSSNELSESFLLFCGRKDVRVDIIFLFLEKGIDPDFEEKKYFSTPLIQLVKNENSSCEMVKTLVQGGASLNKVDRYYRSALVYCCARKKVEVETVQFLVENKGRGIDEALGEACQNPSINLDVVRLLLNLGASPNTFLTSGKSPFKLACKNASVSFKLLKLLFEYGANDFERIFKRPFVLREANENIFFFKDRIYFYEGEQQNFGGQNMPNGNGTMKYFCKGRSQPFVWSGEWKRGKQWEGKGVSFWRDHQKILWIIEAEFLSGNPEGPVFMTSFQNTKNSFKGNYSNGFRGKFIF